MGDAMAMSPVDGETDVEADEEASEEMAREMRDAMREVMRLSGGIYDRMSADVYFTDRGIEINGSVTLSY